MKVARWVREETVGKGPRSGYYLAFQASLNTRRYLAGGLLHLGGVTTAQGAGESPTQGDGEQGILDLNKGRRA